VRHYRGLSLRLLTDSFGKKLTASSKWSKVAVKFDFGGQAFICKRGERGKGGLKCTPGEDILGDLGEKLFKRLKELERSLQLVVKIPEKDISLEIINDILSDESGSSPQPKRPYSSPKHVEVKVTGKSWKVPEDVWFVVQAMLDSCEQSEQNQKAVRVG